MAIFDALLSWDHLRLPYLLIPGHQGAITASTGALMWLKGIYKVDLSTNDFDTSFNTDLHTVAEDAMNSHDPNYNK